MGDNEVLKNKQSNQSTFHYSEYISDKEKQIGSDTQKSNQTQMTPGANISGSWDLWLLRKTLTTTQINKICVL